jgi:hypothetical protein
MNRKLWLGVAIGATVVAVVIGWQARVLTAQLANGNAAQAAQPGQAQTAKAAAPLPVGQVVLFSSGVGYFQREGDVDGNSRVDLSFAASDINDLLKSLVLQDLNGGKISTVSYDSSDPLEKTLRSFALDLTYNPSFGQLLNQARGEKIEVVLQQSNNSQPGTMTGVIVGMESRKGKDNTEIELLNLLCAEGMRNIPLEHIQRVRFLNPVLDSEFRRALEVLASGHDTQKKTVSLEFSGDGKRKVRVGYVVENPIWKTSYRLVLSKDGKAYLQGWAMVENTTDEDWKNVRMVLISGRPISFQMDLYQPLHMPRPTVEPEKFASLRPPAYNGALSGEAANAPQGVPFQGGFNQFSLGVNPFGNQGGMAGQPFVNRYQLGNNQFGNIGGGFGMQGGVNNAFGNPRPDPLAMDAIVPQPGRKLTFEELQARRLEQQGAKDAAKKVGSAITALDPSEGVAAVASGDEIGDYFQYAIDHRVNLARQKSALLPIVDHSVAGTKVSIFNEGIHAKFPLFGYKLKNTTAHHLMQGPITVYEEGSYAGDSRIMDLQPNEERLISYAVDTGVEVKAEAKHAPEQLVSVKLVKGVLHVSNKLRQTKTYQVKNRAEHERTLVIEHPINANWKLVTPEKPSERSRDVYRFQINVPAGKSATQEVVEETTRFERIELTASDEKTIGIFLNSNISSPAVKQALQKTLGLRMRVADTKRELTQLEQKIKAITDDQARLRANLDKVPPTSAAHKRYLEKFDTQETEIEKLQATQMQKQETLEKQQKEYEDSLASLTAE